MLLNSKELGKWWNVINCDCVRLRIHSCVRNIIIIVQMNLLADLEIVGFQINWEPKHIYWKDIVHLSERQPSVTTLFFAACIGYSFSAF